MWHSAGNRFHTKTCKICFSRTHPWNVILQMIIEIKIYTFTCTLYAPSKLTGFFPNRFFLGQTVLLQVILLKTIKNYHLPILLCVYFHLYLTWRNFLLVSQCLQNVWHQKRRMPKFLQNNFAFDSVIFNVVENPRPFQGPTYSLKFKTFFMGLPKIQA